MRRRAYVRYIEEEMEKQIREYDSRFDRYGGGGSMDTSQSISASEPSERITQTEDDLISLVDCDFNTR